MSKIIEEYYAKAKVMPLLLKSKMAKLSKNPDIASELEYWIINKQYKNGNCVEVEGYSAKKLSEMSKYLEISISFESSGTDAPFSHFCID